MTPPTVWLATVEPGPHVRDADRRCLTREELARAGRLRVPGSRARHVAGRAGVRRILAARLGCPPVAVPLVVTPRGELRVVGHPSLHASVSHTAGLVLVAVADGARVGVDAERLDRRHVPPLEAWVDPEEAAALPAPSEAAGRRALLALWTAKEAVAKALGTGLLTPLRAVTVVRGEVGGAATATGTWALGPVAVPTTHVATLAVWQPEGGQGRGPLGSPARATSSCTGHPDPGPGGWPARPCS